MVSGFVEKAQVTGAFNIDEEFFASDLTFPDTPKSTQRAIQVQILTDQTSVIEISLNGTTFLPINNGVGIFGLATFTFLVDDATALNFRNSDVVGLAVQIVVAQ